jgi:hypothetical protein
MDYEYKIVKLVDGNNEEKFLIKYAGYKRNFVILKEQIYEKV